MKHSVTPFTLGSRGSSSSLETPAMAQYSGKKFLQASSPTGRVAIEWLPRPHKNTPTEFYMKKKQQKAQNVALTRDFKTTFALLGKRMLAFSTSRLLNVSLDIDLTFRVFNRFW